MRCALIVRQSVIWALLLGPTPLAAQRQGTVYDSSGAPVRDALVEAWSPTRRLATVRTDAAGRWVLPADSVRDATGLLVRRLGFRPLRTAWHETAGPARLTIGRQPATLPEVAVVATARCPQRDEPAARALWTAVAAHYTSGVPWTYGTRFADRRAAVDEGEIGPMTPGLGRNGLEATRGSGMDAVRITREGYVWPLRGTHAFEDFGIWQYPPLEGSLAWHFTDTSFAARHTFRVSRRSAEAIVLAVCPSGRRPSGLEGELAVAPDSSGFLGARWRVRSRARGTEPTGGEVSFAPRPRPGQPPVLLPAAGYFWRRLPSGRYHVHWREYDEWVVRPSSVPPYADSLGLTASP